MFHDYYTTLISLIRREITILAKTSESLPSDLGSYYIVQGIAYQYYFVRKCEKHKYLHLVQVYTIESSAT